MKSKLYSILAIVLLSGCTSTQINSSVNNDRTTNTIYQEPTAISKKIDYKEIEIKPSNEDKIFTREYTYNSSEDDSKNSSRKKAIQQIKILLTEEIGTHIESYLEIKKKNINGTSYKSIKQEIQSLSASITKVKVLKEKWDGKTYYIKASVRVNEKRTMELLLQSIKAKSSQKDIKRLNKILAEQKILLNQQNSKVQSINKKLISQEIINEARKNEVLNMKKQLVKFNKEELKQKQEVKKRLSELEKVKIRINKIKKKIKIKNTNACLVEKGMTKKDIVSVIGSPSSIDSGGQSYGKYDYTCHKWYYGTVVLDFESTGILQNKYGCN